MVISESSFNRGSSTCEHTVELNSSLTRPLNYHHIMLKTSCFSLMEQVTPLNPVMSYGKDLE